MLLDLVRDPGVLAQRVRDHGGVLVKLAYSSTEVLCHCLFQGSDAGAETRTGAVKKRSIYC